MERKRKVEGNYIRRPEKYRHEFKYLCSEAQLVMLAARLKGIMRPDSHTGADGRYMVKSLYFDDEDDRCFVENEDGTGPREKYRIRIYDNKADRISLECKRKESDKVMKKSCLLTQEQFRVLACGTGAGDMEGMPGLARRLLTLKKSSGMKPKVIVSYERTPYVYKNGNVRVTFDRNIASSSNVKDFFAEHGGRRLILPSGQQLLEVKYDEYLPDHIYRALSLANMQRITFSKYYLCRRYHL